MKQVFRLVHEEARKRAVAAVARAPDGMVVTLSEPTRNSEQNSRFHACCSDLAKSDLQWAGKRRDAASWKVLLISGHATATREGSEMVPGIEGEFVNVRESSALMSVKRASSLIEYTSAFMALHGVTETV